MERRRQPRFEVDQLVAVTLLGGLEKTVAGRLVNVSGKGLGLEVPEELPPGAAVRIDADDNLYLGEVVFCRGADGGFEVGVQLEHALYNLTELRERNEQLFTGVRR